MSIYINSYTLFSSFILYIFCQCFRLQCFFFLCISKCSFHSLFAETASFVTSEVQAKQLADFRFREWSFLSHILEIRS